MKHARKRVIWLVVIAVIAVTVAGGIWWSAAHAPSPQIITLPNGLKFQFAGVTYGTNNVPPSLLAKAVHWLPKPLADRVRKYAGDRITQWNEGYPSPEPRFYIWFERVGTNGPAGPTLDPAATLADASGVEGGATDQAGAFASSVAWSYFSFPVVPRRSRVIQCDLYQSGAPYNSPTGNGQFATIRFRNPRYNPDPTWQPEPIPAVKKSGDLEVRLEKFGIGSRESGRARQTGIGVGTYFDVTLKSTAGTNEQWVTQAAELSDATGNVLPSSSQVGSSGNVSSPMAFLSERQLAIPGTLWPDEGAWKLKLWVKRKLPLGTGEYVTFRNVPVSPPGATNWTPITNTVGGVKVVLAKFIHNPGPWIMRNAPTTLRVEWPDRPEDVAVDFVGFKTDTGDQLRAEDGSTGWGPFYREVYLQAVPTNAQRVDITWAVQRMRSVEFLVKPPN